MAFPAWTSWLFLSLLIAVARPAGSLLLQCYDPAPTALTNATNTTELFRASLLPLLAALPTAAAPTGFASLRSGRAFVRGLCFGDASETECVGCLSNITAGCGAASHRAAIWMSGCLLVYADTDTFLPSTEELLLLSGSRSGPAFYDAAEISSGERMLQATAEATTVTSPSPVASDNSSYYVRSDVRVVAQCARGSTAAADCVPYLQDSARAVGWDLAAARVGGRLVAAVVGVNCYVRVELSNWS